MIIPQTTEKVVYLYDLQGNPVSNIDPIGRDEGKISKITDVWYNEDSQLIDIYDRRLSKVLSFDLTGKLVEEGKIENAETGMFELRFARSKNMVTMERLSAGKHKTAIYRRVQKKLNENSNPVLLFFKLKDF